MFYLEKLINKSPDSNSLKKRKGNNISKRGNKNINFQFSSSSSLSSSNISENLRETEVESF